MNWRAIGKRIRQQREFMGLTREQFAEQIDVTPKFCSDIEAGVKGMSVPTLCRIAKVLRLVRNPYLCIRVSKSSQSVVFCVHSLSSFFFCSVMYITPQHRQFLSIRETYCCFIRR